MIYKEVPEELNLEVKADENCSQILIQSFPHSKDLEEARKIIEDLGARIVETKSLSSNWMLLKLNVADMRRIALKLTESGFVIKGINASMI